MPWEQCDLVFNQWAVSIICNASCLHFIDYVKCPCSILAQCHSNLFIFNNDDNNNNDVLCNSDPETLVDYRLRLECFSK